MPTRTLLIVLGLIALVTAGPAFAQNRSILVATTTMTQESGLFGYLLPLFKARTGIDVKIIPQSTNQALDAGRRGEIDVLFVHGKAQEQKFVADGYGAKRFPVMYNKTVLIGPKNDPAGAKGANILASLHAIRDKAAPFVSRGNRSTTDIAELDLWQEAGIDIAHEGSSWYRALGQETDATLVVTSATNAYMLIDRASWIRSKNKGALAILVESDPHLFIQYGLILVNPEKHPNVKKIFGQAFIDWLISLDGQNAIANYKIDGQQLYFPNANDPGA